MFKKQIDNIKTGDILGSIMYDKNDMIYALPGQKITENFLNVIKKEGIKKVIVDYEIGENVDKNLLKYQKKFHTFNKRYMSYKQFIVKNMNELREYVFNKIFVKDQKDIAGIKYSSVLRSMILKNWDKNITNYLVYAYPIALLSKYNNKLFEFSVKKAVVSAIIAIKMKYEDKSIIDIFFAALLSRIGQLIMDVKEIECNLNNYLYYSIFHYSYSLLMNIGRIQVSVLRTIYYSYNRYSYLSKKSFLSMRILNNAQILKVVDFYLSNIKYYDNRLDYETVEETLAEIYLKAGSDYSVKIAEKFPFSRREFPIGSWVKIIDKIYYTNYIGKVIRGNIDPKQKSMPKIKVLFNDKGTRLKKPAKVDLAMATLKIIKYYGDYQEAVL